MYELGLVPEFTIDITEGAKSFERLNVEVEESQINQEIENLQLRHGDVSHPDNIQMKDIVSVEFVELDENGSIKEEGINHNAAVTTDMTKEDFFIKLETAKKEDQFDWDITNIYDREKADFLKNVLEFKGNEEEVNNTFQLKVLNINRLVKSEVNKDFFEKAFPGGEVKSIEELNANISGQMQDYLNQQAEIKLENDLFESLINDTEIPLPENFLKKWIKTTNEKPITDEQIEQDFDKVTRDIKWSLIENKLSQEYNIDISTEEIKDETRVQLLQQMAQYGMGMMDEERTNEFVENMMKREDHIRQTAGRIMQKKLFGALKEKVDIVEKKVKLDTFKELIATEKK